MHESCSRHHVDITIIENDQEEAESGLFGRDSWQMKLLGPPQLATGKDDQSKTIQLEED